MNCLRRFTMAVRSAHRPRARDAYAAIVCPIFQNQESKKRFGANTETHRNASVEMKGHGRQRGIWTPDHAPIELLPGTGLSLHQ
jgi:hypothetical protein